MLKIISLAQFGLGQSRIRLTINLGTEENRKIIRKKRIKNKEGEWDKKQQ